MSSHFHSAGNRKFPPAVSEGRKREESERKLSWLWPWPPWKDLVLCAVARSPRRAGRQLPQPRPEVAGHCVSKAGKGRLCPQALQLWPSEIASWTPLLFQSS